MSRRRKTETHENARGVSPKGVVARTENQKRLIKSILHNDVTMCYGPAGSGKTHIAAGIGVQMLRKGDIDRLVITRPAVDSGASIGFLPGTLEDKIGPYVTPLFDELGYYVEAKTLKQWIEMKTLEIVPLPMMRGRTFNRTVAILDEAQNCTKTEIRMFLTRMGMQSHMVLVGDLEQSDLPKSQQGGFRHSMLRLEDIEGVAIVELDQTDIVRHPLLQIIDKRLA